MTPTTPPTANDNRGKPFAETICGVLAALLGGAGLAVALFSDSMVSVSGTVITSSVPLCAPAPCAQASVTTNQTESVTHTSIAAGGISGTLEVFVIGVIVVLAVIALGAVMHGMTARVFWLVLLCLATGLLLLATVLTGFSIGLFLLPADALAVAAAALGLAQVAGPPRPVTFPGR
jgi:hypothetical protein